MASTATLTPGPPSPPPPPKRFRKPSRLKRDGRPSTSTSAEQEFTLDTNTHNMEGIIDPRALYTQTADGKFGVPQWGASRANGFGSPEELGPVRQSPTQMAPAFTNPFLATSSMGASRRHVPESLSLSVSPKTLPSLPMEALLDGNQAIPRPNWVAPESWAIERDDDKDGGYSSSDESFSKQAPSGIESNGIKNGKGHGATPPSPSTKGKSRETVNETPARRALVGQKSQHSLASPPRTPSTAATLGAPRTPMPAHNIRVYRSDGTYHVVSCPFNTTVADLQHVLNKKLLLTRETHRLYLKERGRERNLGPQEKPASIMRRRLEQAGYTEADGLETVGGEDLAFLLRFFFRNASLGGMEEEEDSFPTFEFVDLMNRALQTIPIVLHRHASSIVTLNLSKNPLIELPLDFIQSCTKLRELRLSHVAAKRVPSSISQIASLHRLDISCNRIVELGHAQLHQIPDLRDIKVQNNRLTSLPSTFAQMKGLKFLNISNNKFEQIPSVLFEVISLVDLDVSFNMISVFPVEMTRLVDLERLIIVGNQITSFPGECSKLVRLREVDCRRNAIGDLSPLFKLPVLETLLAEQNAVHVLDLAMGHDMISFTASHNPITAFKVSPPPKGYHTYSLTSLNLCYIKISTFDEDGVAFTLLTSLTSLKLDHNKFQSLPDSICSLPELTYLSCTNNELGSLPEGIGRLQKLQTLIVHNNNIKAVPQGIWLCKDLIEFNASSNIIEVWHDPPVMPAPPDALGFPDDERKLSAGGVSFSSTGSSTTAQIPPPLAQSLEKLYLADNRLTDDVFHPLVVMQSLHVLNLSFNEIHEVPPLRVQTFTRLRELYLSGNMLTSFPGEGLYRLHKLRILFLNANKLQTLPAELRKVQNLEVLDVGSNLLKYNITNWQFDWNWNWNRELRYLNLSGNKRLEIKADKANTVPPVDALSAPVPLAEFVRLDKLRTLGLMDVTLIAAPTPDENESCRVRTIPSEINGMAYGIADSIGSVDQLSMFDLVLPQFRSRENANECLFGMFGRIQPQANSNRLAKFLHENFSRTFITNLKKLDPKKQETVEDALRRTFLTLNKMLYDFLVPPTSESIRKMSHASVHSFNAQDIKSGVSAAVMYIVANETEKLMYVANVGDMLAVVSKRGVSHAVSRKHDPFDRNETMRIRAAEGWVSPKGMVNDESELSRSFGLYHLLPAVNASPDIRRWTLSDEDEFVILGNSGLWDHVSPQTAVDIARSSRDDPMIAAQKLRDFAIGYGADGNVMIMVIAVGDLFPTKNRPTTAADRETFFEKRAPRRERVFKTKLDILGMEVPPPTGHLALVFTDIRNSTTLWEKNLGMPVAMRVHNALLRRQLRIIGGYEVKTEGDAFMVSFSTVSAALLWCFTVQLELLTSDWPLEILESEEGQEVYDTQGKLIARGLSVRMGIHWGRPVCESDPVTARMDYFGPMVNRSARIEGAAAGGQIMVSSDVIQEITPLLKETGAEGGEGRTLDPEVQRHCEALNRMGVVIVEVGERSLKGLEVPEILSLVWPQDLAGRLELANASSAPAQSSRVQFSVDQIKQLAMLCIRLEALTSGRVFRDISSQHKKSIRPQEIAPEDPVEEEHSVILYGNPELLMPAIQREASDADLLLIIDSLSCRIENALATLQQTQMGGYDHVLSALEHALKLDPRMLMQALRMFGAVEAS
ncbi:hypothetical protein BOTBODRAFT_199137 [Botryobasidium botryosum FD-172 SS1]|uniref:Adenylate cyclase n=1 Tax=Botryobasidium botryosum (strain FD-172 SS1) TaxID=930990 RepID=A0A067N040_BOTB1|nr:hypothetical protein BOTBODRAFT_199137 [Botryobasidium botryosum FD-172 SS1]